MTTVVCQEPNIEKRPLLEQATRESGVKDILSSNMAAFLGLFALGGLSQFLVHTYYVFHQFWESLLGC